MKRFLKQYELPITLIGAVCAGLFCILLASGTIHFNVPLGGRTIVNDLTENASQYLRNYTLSNDDGDVSIENLQTSTIKYHFGHPRTAQVPATWSSKLGFVQSDYSALINYEKVGHEWMFTGVEELEEHNTEIIGLSSADFGRFEIEHIDLDEITIYYEGERYTYTCNTPQEQSMENIQQNYQITYDSNSGPYWYLFGVMGYGQMEYNHLAISDFTTSTPTIMIWPEGHGWEMASFFELKEAGTSHIADRYEESFMPDSTADDTSSTEDEKVLSELIDRYFAATDTYYEWDNAEDDNWYYGEPKPEYRIEKINLYSAASPSTREYVDLFLDDELSWDEIGPIEDFAEIIVRADYLHFNDPSEPPVYDVLLTFGLIKQDNKWSVLWIDMDNEESIFDPETWS